MSFTQPCFIRNNTAELRKKLEELGYKQVENGVNEWHIPIDKLSWLGCNLYSDGNYMGVNGHWSDLWIDCGDNESLFLALCALNSDNDYKQWFIDEADPYKTWYLCYLHHKEDCLQNTSSCRKATAQEILEHFKI